MLNDVKAPPPPPEPEPVAGPGVSNGPIGLHAARSEARPHNAAVRPHEHLQPTIDRKEPGLHHARILGEKTPTDAIYAMPMEDRGSVFSVTLSIIVIAVFAVLVVTVWLSLR